MGASLRTAAANLDQCCRNVCEKHCGVPIRFEPLFPKCECLMDSFGKGMPGSNDASPLDSAEKTTLESVSKEHGQIHFHVDLKRKPDRSPLRLIQQSSA